MAKLVKTGDIIRLRKGMHITTLVPSWICDKEHPFSKNRVSEIIEIGKVYRSNPFSSKEVLEKVKTFLHRSFNVEMKDIDLESFVDKLPIDYEVKEFDTSIFECEYVVKSADYLKILIHPYYVVCYKKDDPSVIVSFYQGVPFSNKNIDCEIEVVGHIYNLKKSYDVYIYTHSSFLYNKIEYL